MKQLRCISLLLLVMVPIVVQAQAVSTLHLSQDFYVSGDDLFYKVYLPQSFKTDEAVFDIALVNEANIPITRFFQKNERSKNIFGSIQIPVDINSGVYHLIISGTDSKTNKQLRIAEASIPIYNDLKNDLSVSSSHEPSSTRSESLPRNLITIQVDSIYSPRDQIRVKVKIKDLNGLPVEADHSVTIRQVSPAGISNTAIQQSALLDSANLVDKIRLTGTIREENGQGKKFPVMGIYMKEQNDLQLFQSDEEGKYAIELAPFSGDQTIQFLDYLQSDIQVLIDQPKLSKENKSLISNPDITHYLALSNKRKKINQLFGKQNTISIDKEEPDQAKRVEGDRVFILEQYESFKNMTTMFKELISALQFKTDDDGNLYARVFNADPAIREYYPSKPLFIIDGIVTIDANLVNDLDMNYVDRIDIFSDYDRLKEHFGPLGLGGVVVIETSMPSIRLTDSRMDDIFTINGLRNFEDSNHSLSFEQSTIPRLDPHIFWSPVNRTDPSGEYEYSCRLGDHKGQFIIELVAQDDNGNVSIASQLITIQ